MYSSNKGDFPVLDCVSSLSMIFASLASTHEHARIHNLRDFPQAKLDIARFHLNEHDDSPFSIHELKEKIVLKESTSEAAILKLSWKPGLFM